MTAAIFAFIRAIFFASAFMLAFVTLAAAFLTAALAFAILALIAALYPFGVEASLTLSATSFLAALSWALRAATLLGFLALASIDLISFTLDLRTFPLILSTLAVTVFNLRVAFFNKTFAFASCFLIAAF